VRVPAVTEQVTEQVCVRPASCTQVWVPPETQQVCRQVCVKEACRKPYEIPAEYQDVCEQVCTAPARVEWQRVNCEPTRLAPNEQVGECWTLREVPAQYESRTRRVCVREACMQYEEIPAEYQTVTETVEVRPGYYKNVEVPAQYETKVREVVVCGPRWEWRRTTECEVPADTTAGGFGQPAAGWDSGAAGGIASPDGDSVPGAAPAAPQPSDPGVPPTGLPPLEGGN